MSNSDTKKNRKTYLL